MKNLNNNAVIVEIKSNRRSLCSVIALFDGKPQDVFQSYDLIECFDYIKANGLVECSNKTCVPVARDWDHAAQIWTECNEAAEIRAKNDAKNEAERHAKSRKSVATIRKTNAHIAEYIEHGHGYTNRLNIRINANDIWVKKLNSKRAFNDERDMCRVSFNEELTMEQLNSLIVWAGRHASEFGTIGELKLDNGKMSVEYEVRSDDSAEFFAQYC